MHAYRAWQNIVHHNNSDVPAPALDTVEAKKLWQQSPWILVQVLAGSDQTKNTGKDYLATWKAASVFQHVHLSNSVTHPQASLCSYVSVCVFVKEYLTCVSVKYSLSEQIYYTVTC